MTNHLLTIGYWSNKLHLCSLLNGAGVELKIIDELIGGMPSWTEKQIVKGQTQIYFSPKEEHPQEKQKQYAELVQYKMNALNMQLNSQKSSVFGEAFQKEKEDVLKGSVQLNLTSEM